MTEGTQQPRGLTRPPVRGRRFVISSTHYLATAAGMEMFARGGNAVDAGVAAGIALGVVERNLIDFGGIAPLMIHRPGMDYPAVYDGVGRWPINSTLDQYLARYGGDMPRGVPQAVVPGAPDAWFTALSRYGTLKVAEVLEPAIALAEGFPVSARLARAFSDDAETITKWPSTAAVFHPGGSPLEENEILVQDDLASLFRRLIAAERATEGSREDRIAGARDEFYLGDVAEQIIRFISSEGGALTMEDMRRHAVSVEEPATSSYKGYMVYATGPYSQGPVIPLVLNLLEDLDAGDSAPNDPVYLHALIQTIEAALADREGFFGDPEHVDVPMKGLLSKEYAAERRSLIGDRRIYPGLPPPGDPWRFEGRSGPPGYVAPTVSGPTSPDTGYVAALDGDGLAFSATPSDSATLAPLVPGLGIVVSPRGCQLFLDRRHPSALAPGKRPRITPNPAMVLKDGVARLAFGCPGADAQSQAMIQVLINVIGRSMNLQEAIEIGRIVTYSAPDSFFPHASRPGVVGIESSVPVDVRDALADRGHTVQLLPWFSNQTATVCGVLRHENGSLEGGSDPRRDSLAAGH